MTKTTPAPRSVTTTPNLSAACGAWSDGHDYCTGHVALPAPRDVCECECHELVFGAAGVCSVCDGDEGRHLATCPKAKAL